MYKNQLQELAQRSCFNLPSYACIREGPDHAPRFRASVNFNGEVFEGPSYCTTLRQAEHAAAEVALSNLSTRGPSRSLAARVLDETGVYKNLLQETAHRAGLRLPVYTTVRSGPGHSPVFTCAVELAGMNFAGEPAKTKKQAEKNAAMAAWAALRQMPNLGSLSVQIKESESSEEQEQVVVARVLSNFRPKEENKPMRQRDQQLQQRRRVLLGYKEGAAGSSHNSLRYRHQWRSSGPLSDASSVYPTQQQQRQSSLLALPPKILLAPLPLFQHSYATTQEPSSSMDNNCNPSLISSSKPIPVQMKNRSQVIIQEIPTPMDEHRRDDKEWIDEGSAVKGKDIEKDSYNAKPTPASSPVSAPHGASHLHSSSGLATRTPDSKTHQIQFSSRAFSPPPPTPMRSLPSFPIPRVINSGGFHAPGIAPAVHVRSVIPVCAAPPMRPPPSTAASSMREPEELSAANSKLNKLQL